MTDTDRTLLERWYTQRDAEAFKVIAQRHAGMVFATCCRVLRNATDAEDAVAGVAPYALTIKLTKLARAGRAASVFGTSVGLLFLKVAAVFAVAAVAGIAVWQGIGSRESVSVFLGDTVGNPQSADPSLEPILLEFTPTLGEPIAYEITVNLDKITLGRTGNENVSAVTVMTPGKRLDDGYAMTMTVHVNSHNLDELIAEHMAQKANAGKALTISDAFVFSGEDGPSLYCPQTPVSVGDSWEAEGVFAFGDLLTLDPPLVRWRFTVNRITPEADRTLAHIGVELLTHEAEVPFQMGRAGIRCNEDGMVSELEGDAAGKLRVGDRIIAIGGKPAPDPRTRSILTQNFIEDLDLVNEPVQLTIERDGNELNVSVEKSVVSLGTIGVTFSDYTRTAIFDADAGLLDSDDSTANIELRYTVTPEMDFLDDLRGRTESPSLQNSIPGADMPPRIYQYHWKMNRLASR